MLEMILNIALVVAGFSFIIAIHELGHFLAAKRAGIECPVYSIGFPLPPIKGLPDRLRNIISIHWRGTDYRLGWIPFGGFVQMKGQSDTPEGLEENDKAEDDFRNVSYGNKVLVITGGVIMNAITGIIFFILAFAVFGVTFIAPKVGAVLPTDAKDPTVLTKLWLGGKVNAGDNITAVNGEHVEDYEDAAYAAFFDEDGVIEMTFENPSTGVKTTLPVDLYNISSKLDAKLPPVMMSAQIMAGDIEAEASGGALKSDDEILKINGLPIRSTPDIQAASNTIKKGEKATLLVLRDGKEVEVSYTPRLHPFLHNDHIFGMSFAQKLVILGVQDGGAGAKAGMKAGDEIVSIRIDGDEASTWSERVSQPMLREALTRAGNAEKSLMLRVKRGKENVELALTPELVGATPSLYAISVIFSSKELLESTKGESLVVADVLADSAAARAGIKAGDKIVDFPELPAKIEKGGILGIGASIEDVTLYQRIATAANKISASVAESGATSFDSVKARIEQGTEQKDVELSVSLDDPNARALFVFAARTQRTDPITYGFGEAIGVGFTQTHKNMTKIMLTLKGLFTGAVSPTQLAGPVMIAKASYDLTQYGFGTLLFFLGFISINLAVVNILPVPVLDGGLLLIVTLEKLKGGPLPEKIMGMVNLVSFLFVIGLMLFVVFNDVRNLFFL